MAQLCVRVPDEMKEELEKAASADKRSVAFIVKEAIQEYLNKLNLVQNKEN